MWGVYAYWQSEESQEIFWLGNRMILTESTDEGRL